MKDTGGDVAMDDVARFFGTKCDAYDLLDCRDILLHGRINIAGIPEARMEEFIGTCKCIIGS
ncbi:MAG: hypothetical protein PHX87_00740 [Candidatus Peribacteraceae bacterium]|nr:hypothetical protein [Candidatus Peribacteraceae bacterium]MDD5741935.1 hypothetical protein [Candidatus Peribacteraceae bacterium]